MLFISRLNESVWKLNIPLPIIVDSFGLPLILMKYSNALFLFSKIRLN